MTTLMTHNNIHNTCTYFIVYTPVKVRAVTITLSDNYMKYITLMVKSR